MTDAFEPSITSTSASDSVSTSTEPIQPPPQEQIDAIVREQLADPAMRIREPSKYARMNQEVQRLAGLMAADKDRAEENRVEELLLREDPASAKLKADAQKELDQLVELGFDPAELPEVVEPYLRDGLKMQRLHAQGNYDELAPMLADALRKTGTPPEMADLFRQFASTQGIDPNLRDEIADKLIRFAHEGNKARAEQRERDKPQWLKDHEAKVKAAREAAQSRSRYSTWGRNYK